MNENVSWSPINNIDPRTIARGANQRGTFTCNRHYSEHSWESKVVEITSGRGCPYPGCRPNPHRMCDKFDCKTCEPNAVSSIPIIKNKTILWSSRNILPSHRVTRGTLDLHWFECLKHSPIYVFQVSAAFLNAGGGCLGCNNKTENAILTLLEEKYEIIRQHIFPGFLCNTRHYKFDGFIKSLKIIIEVFF